MSEILKVALRARQMYADGDPVDYILVETRLAIKEFYDWLDGASQPDGITLLPPIPRRDRFKKRSLGSARERVKLIGRMMRAAERQARTSRDRFEAEGIAPTGRESDTRALAMVARTLRELTALDELNRGRKNASKPIGKMTNPFPETSTSSDDHLRAGLKRILPSEATIYLGRLTPDELEMLDRRWRVFAHQHQRPLAKGLSTCLILGGRGAGKTRASAERVRDIAVKMRPRALH